MAPVPPGLPAAYGFNQFHRPFDHQQIYDIERALGVTFSDKSLLITALTHASYLNEPDGADSQSNDRLETLGDAVLGLAITHALYESDAELGAGQLTLIRSKVVNNKTLAHAARSICIGDYLLMGSGEAKSGGADGNSNLAGAFEAIVGAIFLDHMSLSQQMRYFTRDEMRNPAFDFCTRILDDAIDDAYDEVTSAPPKPKKSGSAKNSSAKEQSNKSAAAKNASQAAYRRRIRQRNATSDMPPSNKPNIAGKHPKSALQELAQSEHGVTPEYSVIDESGKSNAPTFTVEVAINGKARGKGSGASKKDAETNAAKAALKAFTEAG